MTLAVQMKNITHVYIGDKGAHLALERIGLNIVQGELVSLVGPSGCGKTTLLSLIAGLLKPTHGTINILGKEVTGPSNQVGYMLQQDYLFPWRTILENACIGLETTGTLTEESKKYALHLLDEMGLADFANKFPQELSGGMRQRVALVRTLALEPDILLLDEPFSALDYTTKLQLEDLLAETLKERKKTGLLVTHDITEALAMSDRVFIMEPYPGRIRRELRMPKNIASALPIHARDQAGFQELFYEIWREFETMDRKR